MSSGKAYCSQCNIVIKLSVCGGCPEGYDPIVCPKCGGEITIETAAVSETEEE